METQPIHHLRPRCSRALQTPEPPHLAAELDFSLASSTPDPFAPLVRPSFPKHACLVWHGRAMSPEPDSLKHGRVLACALCKQRRVKCSRTFPCTNCVRAGAQCVQPDSRKRRPRFPERQLLDRLRQYEDLLRQNNVEFTPLHSSTAASTAGNDDDGVPSRRVRDSSEAVYVFG